LQDFLGQLEIADEPDQGRENATRLIAEQLFDLLVAHPFSVMRRLQPDRHGGYEYTMMGRTSIEPNFADGTRAAIAVASSRSLASIR
jgi:hypothetical protein